MKRFFFALALLATISLGGLVIETASAQNTNSSTTMNSNMGSMRGRHHRRGHHRRHRRARRATGNANM
ncbi:MAG TPA: hypothetical protein VN951_04360 [Pyrinomonadaceae bacterium]|nr:hypothetical protein [Pyrinomonadaceae bacterium]